MNAGQTIRLASLQALVSGSMHEAVALAEERVRSKLGADARVLALHEDSVVVLNDGAFEKYTYSKESGLGEAKELHVQHLTPVDEAIELRERCTRIVEAAIAGGDTKSAITEVFRAVTPKAMMAEEMLMEDIGALVSENRPWRKLQTERAASLRKYMYGKLGELKERELKPQFRRMYDGTQYSEAELEQARHEIIPALHRVLGRVKEGASSLAGVKMKAPSSMAPDEAATFEMVNAFGSSLVTDVGAMHEALSKHLQLASRTASVQELAKLHDSLVQRVNEYDFASAFYTKAAAQFPEEKNP